VLLFDVDGFKAINDEHGHAAGDAVLVAVVSAARGTLRQSDLLGRLGGDEFAVALPDTPGERARLTAERMREAVAGAEALVGAGHLRTTASIGLAGCAPGAVAPTLEDLLRQADEALYRAKRAGRNRVVEAEDEAAG
jgi:diguanylate cyclase (GGDEF)-like protein